MNCPMHENQWPVTSSGKSAHVITAQAQWTVRSVHLHCAARQIRADTHTHTHTAECTETTRLYRTLPNKNTTEKREMRYPEAIKQRISLRWQPSASQSYMVRFAERDFCTSKIVSWRRHITSGAPMVPRWIKHEGEHRESCWLRQKKCSHFSSPWPRFCLSANVFPSALFFCFQHL